jgi:hypothetical protein
MDPAKLNYLAILAAAASMFLVGGLWYSPVLFGKAWQREVGLSDEELKKRQSGAGVWARRFCWRYADGVQSGGVYWAGGEFGVCGGGGVCGGFGMGGVGDGGDVPV